MSTVSASLFPSLWDFVIKKTLYLNALKVGLGISNDNKNRFISVNLMDAK